MAVVKTDGGVVVPASQYRNLTQQSGSAVASNVTGAGVYKGSGYVAQTASGSSVFSFYLAAADLAIPGLTTKLRLLVSGATNATAPTVSFTFGLYPWGTPIGGSNVVNPQFGTVVTGSTCLFTTPAASTILAPVSSGDFDLPADGLYGIGLSVDGAMAANSAAAWVMALQYHYV